MVYRVGEDITYTWGSLRYHSKLYTPLDIKEVLADEEVGIEMEMENLEGGMSCTRWIASVPVEPVPGCLLEQKLRRKNNRYCCSAE